MVGKVVPSLGSGGGNTLTRGLKRGAPKSQRRNTTKYIHTYGERGKIIEFGGYKIIMI